MHSTWHLSHAMESPDKGCENLIYAVTSGANGFPSAANGYSLPSLIGKAARGLGLTTIAFVPPGILGVTLLRLYGNEESNAQANGTVLVRKEAPRPGSGQRLLKVMRVGDDDSWIPATGLHYVMMRPDGSIMDPATGQNSPNLASLIQAQKTDRVFYADTGVAILIT